MKELRRQVGQRLRELRHARKLSQEALGERAGLSYKFIGEVERGIGNPTLDTLWALARALDVRLTDLLSEEGQATTPYPHLSASDYITAREALETLESVLKRRAGERRRRPNRE